MDLLPPWINLFLSILISLMEQGYKPNSAAAAGCMGPQAVPPDRMVPQKGSCEHGGREYSDTVMR